MVLWDCGGGRLRVRGAFAAKYYPDMGGDIKRHDWLISLQRTKCLRYQCEGWVSIILGDEELVMSKDGQHNRNWPMGESSCWKRWGWRQSKKWRISRRRSKHFLKNTCAEFRILVQWGKKSEWRFPGDLYQITERSLKTDNNKISSMNFVFSVLYNRNYFGNLRFVYTSIFVVQVVRQFLIESMSYYRASKNRKNSTFVEN